MTGFNKFGHTMKRFFLLIIVILSTAFVSYAQEFSKEDEDQYRLALEFSDNGNANKAIDIYNQLLKKYPGNGTLLYELAYCNYVKQDFKSAAKILEKAEKGEPSAVMYALHGNCLDLMGKQDNAIAKYQEGIAKYPDFGQLYLELGTVYRIRNELNSAVAAYAKGIEVDPYFASNYYRISQLLCSSSEPVWGIIYGEIHELLSPNSRRSEELSKAIYDAYNANLKFDNDSTYHITLTRKNQIFKADDGELDIPIELLYEVFTSAFLGNNLDTVREKRHLDMMILADCRRAFLKNCFEGGANEKYLLPLFKYQQLVLDAGHWEAYNMWLLRKGNDEEFSDWLDANEDKFKAFVSWYADHNFDPVEVVK